VEGEAGEGEDEAASPWAAAMGRRRNHEFVAWQL
jgi:hypothetical protein